MIWSCCVFINVVKQNKQTLFLYCFTTQPKEIRYLNRLFIISHKHIDTYDMSFYFGKCTGIMKGVQLSLTYFHWAELWLSWITCIKSRSTSDSVNSNTASVSPMNLALTNKSNNNTSSCANLILNYMYKCEVKRSAAIMFCFQSSYFFDSDQQAIYIF